jgi:hypothetical protein
MVSMGNFAMAYHVNCNDMGLECSGLPVGVQGYGQLRIVVQQLHAF